VNHLNAFAWEYHNIGNYDTLFLYAKQALSLSQEIKFKKGEANALHNIGESFFHKGNYPEALNSFLSSLKIRGNIKDKNGIAKSLSIIGIVYESKGDYPMALKNYTEALKYAEELKTKNLIISIICNIGNVYVEQADYPRALEYFFKALKTGEESKETYLQETILLNIGSVYYYQTSYAHALEYFFKALAAYEKAGNKNGIATVCISIGTDYLEQAQVEQRPDSASLLRRKALDYLLKALNITKEVGNKNLTALSLDNIGIIYKDQSDYSHALEYYFNSLKINEEIGSKNGIANALGNIGLLHTKTKNYLEAKIYLQHSISLADSIGALNVKRDFEQTLSQLYDTLTTLKEHGKNPEGFQKLSALNLKSLAFEHYKKYITTRDSISNDEQKKKQMRTEVNYEYEKKKIVDKAEQDKKDLIAKEELKRKEQERNYFIIGFALVVLLAGFIFRSLRITRKQKQIIEVQKTEVEKSKHIIEEKNKDITDSINYAKRIQKAMLPHRKDIWIAFPESFVLFKPKDIVSGDFYFFHKNNQSAFVASADCTGHGVPGAFMSMIGSDKLNDAVSESSDTSEILSLLNKGIKSALKQSETDESATRDGMDIALCSVDTNARIVKYAGANRPLWIIRNGSTAVEEIKATKKAIGGFTEDSQHFDTHVIQLQQGDTFYISTDGYADTFGNQDKKLTTKKFKEILLSIQDKSLKEQGQHLDSFIEDWKAGTEQIDDILVIGVRL